MFGSFPKKLYSRMPLSVVFYVFLSISFHTTQNSPDVINAKLHRRVTISRSNRKKCTIFSCKRPEVTGLSVVCFVSWTDEENLPQRVCVSDTVLGLIEWKYFPTQVLRLQSISEMKSHCHIIRVSGESYNNTLTLTRSRFWEPKLKTWSRQIMFYVIYPEIHWK